MAQDYAVDVVRVIDGDSVKVRLHGEEHSVRMYGIDAPEKAQAGGSASTRYLERIVRSERRWRLHVLDRDRYQRLVGILYPEAGSARYSANHEMVRAGWAYWYREYGGQEWGFDKVEREAQRQRAGVWADERAVRPWDYRKAKRAGHAERRKKAQEPQPAWMMFFVVIWEIIKLFGMIVLGLMKILEATGGSSGGSRRRRRRRRKSFY